MVQWLRLCASSARGAGSIHGRGTKTPHAKWHGQTNKQNKQNPPQKTVGPISRVSDSVGLGWGRKFSFLTRFQILLVVFFQVSYFEKYCSNLTCHCLVSNHPGLPLSLKLEFQLLGLVYKTFLIWSFP